MQNNTTVRIALWGLLLVSNSIMAMEIATSNSQPNSPHEEQEDYRTLMMSSQSGRQPISQPITPTSSSHTSPSSSPRNLTISQVLPDISKSPIHSPSISGSNSPRNQITITEEEITINLSKDTPTRQTSKEELKKILIDFKKSSSSSQDNAASSSDFFSVKEENSDSQKEILPDENGDTINYVFSNTSIPNKPIYMGGIIKNADEKYELSFEENNKIYRIFFPGYPTAPCIVIKNSNLEDLFTIRLLPQYITNTPNNSSPHNEESKKQMEDGLFTTKSLPQDETNTTNNSSPHNEESKSQILFGSLTSNFNDMPDNITVYQGVITNQLDGYNVEITYVDNNNKVQKINVSKTLTLDSPTYALIKNSDGHLKFVIELSKQENTNATDDFSRKSTPKRFTPKNNKRYIYTAALGGAFIAMMVYAAYKYNKLDGLMNLLNNLRSNCNNLISSRFSR